MLIKWITCHVHPGAEMDFSVSQRAWARLAAVTGFRGQLGGWSNGTAKQACVLGVWRERSMYERFMAEIHDGITEDNAQERTYESIRVALADVVLEMRGTSADSTTAVTEAGFLRVADCLVHADRSEHFRSVQREIWSPGMKSAGMLHGWFSRVPETNRFLVMSLWPDAGVHRAYRQGPFAQLRQRADATADLAGIEGVTVTIEPLWTVAPTTRTNSY